MRRKCVAPVLVAGILAGCANPPPLDAFAGTTPAFDPVRFYTGHTRSWGVREDRAGTPEGIITTDCVGTADGADGLHMVQHLTLADGSHQTRDWHLRRVGPNRYEGTANDMVGTAIGEAQGRTFHWTWTWATKPGNPLFDVTMDQWMYLMDDGAMVNRTTVSKLGFTIAAVTEQFERAP